jgi:hypothetical protein
MPLMWLLWRCPLRHSTIRDAANWMKAVYDKGYQSGAPTHVGKMGIGGAIRWGFRLLGCATVGASIALLATPWALGWTWIEAIAGCGFGLGLARQFLTINDTLNMVESTFHLLWGKLKGNSFETTFNMMSVTGAPAPQAA